MRRSILAALAAAAIIILGACAGSDDGTDAADASGIESNSGNTDNPPQADLNDDVACSYGVVGPTATGTLTNHSSGLSNYMISVNFLDAAGTIVASGTAFQNGVPGGQTVAWEAQAFVSGEVVFETCEVVKVERLAAAAP